MKTIKQFGSSVTKLRAEAIDNVLSFLFLSENRESWEWIEAHTDDRNVAKAVEIFNKVPLSHFDGADISHLYESCGDTTSYKQQLVNPRSENERKELSRLTGHWAYCLAGYFPEVPNHYSREIKEHHLYLFSLLRYQTVPLREVRGLFPLKASAVVEYSEAHLLNNGTYISGLNIVDSSNLKGYDERDVSLSPFNGGAR